MRVILKKIGGPDLHIFDYVIDVKSAIIDNHVTIITEEENFIFAVQKGEILVIDKNVSVD